MWLKNSNNDVESQRKAKLPIIHSGGAIGSDTCFAIEALKYGIETIAHSFNGHSCQPNSGKRIAHSEQDLSIATEILTNINKKYIKRKFPPNSKFVENLLRRNYFQVIDSQAVIAISTINKYGIVEGGTAWAVYMGIERNIPVFVFDQATNEWHEWVDSRFSIITIENMPKYDYAFAGIGTREISPSGLNAIREYLLKYKERNEENFKA